MVSPGPRLSRRQREVLEHAARGNTERETARDLGIAPATVNTHMRSAFARLGARSTAQAVYLALMAGLLFSDATDFPFHRR